MDFETMNINNTSYVHFSKFDEQQNKHYEILCTMFLTHIQNLSRIKQEPIKLH